MADEPNLGGRPLLYNDPGKLQTAIDSYFASTLRPTLSGLAVHIGMNRASLYNYAQRDGFFDIIKKAQARVEAIYEERLVWDNATGVIFPLKNMGWKDRTDHGIGGMDGEPLPAPIINVITKTNDNG